MPAKNEGVLGLSYGWAYGEDGWHTGMDSNITQIAALLGGSAVSRTVPLACIPLTTNGKVYIIPENKSVGFILDGALSVIPAKKGMMFNIEDENNTVYQFDGTNWIDYLDFGNVV